MFYETEKEFTNKNECILYTKEQGCTLPNFEEMKKTFILFLFTCICMMSYSQSIRYNDYNIHYYLPVGYSASDWKSGNTDCLYIARFKDGRFSNAIINRCNSLFTKSDARNRANGIKRLEYVLNRFGDYKRFYSKDYNLSTNKYNVYTVRMGGGIWGPIVEQHYGVSNDFKSLIVWNNEDTEARSDYYEIDVEGLFPNGNYNFLE